jgi:D-beta-D-heptose 7-phosphate kinase/D-beta-D-heptose 1-phosphate adenosyltransferase
MEPGRARRLVAALPGVRALVVGDVMLDRFIAGRVTRISPEAPVPVVTFEHETTRIGGAGNVAHNIAALGGDVALIAPTGQDEAAATLAQACREAGIAPNFVGDPARRTTTKVRIVTERNQQVARVDYENDTEVSGDVEQRLITSVRQLGPDASVIVVSDYLKGAVSRALMRVIVDVASERGVPVLVDPKIPHIDYYAGTTLVTPNAHEAEAATLLRVRDGESARATARAFRDRVGCGAVLVTRGDQGMWLLSDAAEGSLSASAREVADVTGAGDTVIATAAIALAAGATLAEAAWLANEAAAIAVGRFGPATVSPDELLAAIANAATGR